jgi:hypothetical protein
VQIIGIILIKEVKYSISTILTLFGLIKILFLKNSDDVPKKSSSKKKPEKTLQIARKIKGIKSNIEDSWMVFSIFLYSFDTVKKIK